MSKHIKKRKVVVELKMKKKINKKIKTNHIIVNYANNNIEIIYVYSIIIQSNLNCFEQSIDAVNVFILSSNILRFKKYYHYIDFEADRHLSDYERLFFICQFRSSHYRVRFY